MAQTKAKVVHGPGPRGMGGPRPKVENPGKLLKNNAIYQEVYNSQTQGGGDFDKQGGEQ